MTQETAPNGLAIWDQVESTPAGYTKSAKVDGNNLTSINPHYTYKRATEVFGPIGSGWGWDLIAEGFDDAETYRKRDGEDADGAPRFVDFTPRSHWCRLRVWYCLPDSPEKRCELPEVYGVTPSRYATNKGQGYVVDDSEARKKSMTDAVKRSLSLLGIAGDIFLGMFDDREYVELQLEAGRVQNEMSKADIAGNLEEVKERQLLELDQRAAEHVALMAGAKTERELDTIHTKLVTKVLNPATKQNHTRDRAQQLMRVAQKRRDEYAEDGFSKAVQEPAA